MSTQIVPFEFGGEQVRIVTVDGKPWFVAGDVSRILGYRMASDMTRRLDMEDRGTHSARTPGGEQEIAVISEPGLYSAILGSRVEGAREFKRWVTHDVIPEIRKTGSYSTPKTLEERALELVGELHSKVQEQQAELMEIRPLASQARTFNKRKGNTGRQAFARDVVGLAIDMGVKVTANQVYEFMGVKLDMFIHGAGLRSHGHASLSGKRRGLADTDKGENRHNGHAFEQGMLTPKGVEYAWSRIETYIREHGHLELPKKEIAA